MICTGGGVRENVWYVIIAGYGDASKFTPKWDIRASTMVGALPI